MISVIIEIMEMDYADAPIGAQAHPLANSEIYKLLKPAEEVGFGNEYIRSDQDGTHKIKFLNRS